VPWDHYWPHDLGERSRPMGFHAFRSPKNFPQYSAAFLAAFPLFISRSRSAECQPNVPDAGFAIFNNLSKNSFRKGGDIESDGRIGGYWCGR